eukprot:scaffold116868_cov18-Tisochrysis_lutea.AAC.1
MCILTRTMLLARPKPRRISPVEKLWLALLYTLNMGTSYLLMLAVMTYNIGVCKVHNGIKPSA